MKTKDAFAFRDFDKKRILQRPFFKRFCEDYPAFKGLSDNEILQELTISDTPRLLVLNTLQAQFDALDALLVRTAEYQKHVKRHGERLTKYERIVANKIATGETADIDALRAKFKRATDLSMMYCGCVTDTSSVASYYLGGIAVDDIGGLCQRIAEMYKVADEEMKRFYRRIFADRLKFARRSTGLTQKKFAQKIGISQNGLSLFETGQRDPSIPMLIRFSKTLGRSADWLLGQA